MAITLGATSENLLKGMDRVLASIASALPVPTSRKPKARISRAWASQRGVDIARASVDVSGGFPGCLRWQHKLQSTSLAITDQWLIVGEGTNFGFALPIERITGVSVQPFVGLLPPQLVIWFQDADTHGSFHISFRGTARNRAGEFRAEYMHSRLLDLGVQDVDPESASFTPNIHCSWHDATSLADEEVLLRSNAIASSAGPFASSLDSAVVWITEHSLIWSADHGEGLNCIPLDTIVDCRYGYGDRLTIGIEDTRGGRYDLYFDFSTTDRKQPVAAVIQVLNGAGIPVDQAAMPIAPWRRGGTRRPTDV